MAIKRIKRIGLTGGAGSGKSTAAKFFREAGIRVVDLDEIGKLLLDEVPRLQEQIARLCGPGSLMDGKLDRQMVRDRIFADEEIRRSIEKLLHPLILNRFEKACEVAEKNGETKIICEAALLLETDFHKKLGALIVVMAPLSIRKERLMQRDGLTSHQADLMINAQVDDAARKEAATFTLTNDGTQAQLKSQVTDVLKRLA